jgi:four helix bundle protein
MALAVAKNTALDITLAIIPSIRGIVAKIRVLDRHLADQLRRAVTSLALNLAEADGNRGGNRRMRLLTAHGSANEAKIALRVAVAWGYLEQRDIADVFQTIDRVGAMTWSRMQSR